MPYVAVVPSRTFGNILIEAPKKGLGKFRHIHFYERHYVVQSSLYFSLGVEELV